MSVIYMHIQLLILLLWEILTQNCFTTDCKQFHSQQLTHVILLNEPTIYVSLHYS